VVRQAVADRVDKFGCRSALESRLVLAFQSSTGD